MTPPRYTSARVSRSVITFSASRTAAKAMRPTVAALSPDNRAYTGMGSVDPTREMPTDRPYIPIAPGKLHINVRKKSKKTFTMTSWRPVST